MPAVGMCLQGDAGGAPGPIGPPGLKGEPGEPCSVRPCNGVGTQHHSCVSLSLHLHVPHSISSLSAPLIDTNRISLNTYPTSHRFDDSSDIRGTLTMTLCTCKSATANARHCCTCILPPPAAMGYWWQRLVFSCDNEKLFMLIRRFGKTILMLHLSAVQAMEERNNQWDLLNSLVASLRDLWD